MNLPFLYRFIKWEVEKSVVDKQIASIYDVVEVTEEVSKGAITDVSDLPPEEEKKEEEVVTPVVPTRPNDYWYATVADIFNYEDAVKSLKITDDGIENPSDVTLYIKIDGKETVIEPKSKIKF